MFYKKFEGHQTAKARQYLEDHNKDLFANRETPSPGVGALGPCALLLVGWLALVSHCQVRTVTPARPSGWNSSLLFLQNNRVTIIITATF